MVEGSAAGVAPGECPIRAKSGGDAFFQPAVDSSHADDGRASELVLVAEDELVVVLAAKPVGTASDVVRMADDQRRVGRTGCRPRVGAREDLPLVEAGEPDGGPEKGQLLIVPPHMAEDLSTAAVRSNHEADARLDLIGDRLSHVPVLVDEVLGVPPHARVQPDPIVDLPAVLEEGAPDAVLRVEVLDEEGGSVERLIQINTELKDQIKRQSVALRALEAYRAELETYQLIEAGAAQREALDEARAQLGRQEESRLESKRDVEALRLLIKQERQKHVMNVIIAVFLDFYNVEQDRHRALVEENRLPWRKYLNEEVILFLFVALLFWKLCSHPPWIVMTVVPTFTSLCFATQMFAISGVNVSKWVIRPWF